MRAISRLTAVLSIAFLAACGDSPVAPEATYDTISVKSLAQPTLKMEVGEIQSNSISLCLPRNVNVLDVQISRSNTSVHFDNWNWGMTGGICKDGRDLLSSTLWMQGVRTGETKVSMTFLFSKGDPLTVSFGTVVSPPQVP
jgi:hypothetical protein